MNFKAIKELIGSSNLSVKLLLLFCLGYPFYSWFGTWILILFSIVWVLRLYKNNYEFTASKFHWPFILYFGLHVLGMFWTADYQFGINDLQSKSALLLLPIMIGTLKFTKVEVQLILKTFIVGVVLANVIYIGFSAFSFLNAEHYFSGYFLGGGLTNTFRQHPAYISSYCIFAILHLIDIALQSKPKSRQVLLYFVFIVFLLIMILLYARRMQFLILVIILPIYLWFKYRKHEFFKSALIVTGCFYLFSMLAISNSDYLIKRLEDSKQNFSKSTQKNIRIEIWNASLELIKWNPIAGIGTGDIETELVRSYRYGAVQEAAITQKFNAHNQYLQSFATLGIFGLISYLMLLIIPSYQAIKHGNILIISFYLIFALGTLTECMLETQRGSVWLAVFGSLFWGREDFLNE